jgi:PD-(D/E)XK nuclease superfamily
MNVWHPPAGTSGDNTLIRASNTAVRADPRDCPTAWSTKLRPLLLADPPVRRPGKPLEDFPFRLFMDSLDLIEHQNWPIDRAFAELWRTQGRFGRSSAPAHAAHLSWTVRAVEGFLERRREQQEEAEDAGSSLTGPLKNAEWAVVPTKARPEPDLRGATRYELTAWGRRYVSGDGAVRDLWLPSIGSAKEVRPKAEKAALAYVLARGAVCKSPEYGHDYEPVAGWPQRLPDRVRIFEFGCTAGDVGPLLDLDQHEVQRRFEQDAAPAFARAVEGNSTMPGSSCVGCKAIGGCTALARTPGLWGGEPAQVRQPRRSLSVADMRAYRECPAKYHLTRRLHLKAMLPESDAVIRGRAVDARLDEQHQARPDRGCRSFPGPPDPSRWSSGGFDLVGEVAREAAAMLAQHAATCPLDGLGRSESVRVQYQLTSYVPELDVVVVAKPDLTYSRGGGWILRESKTAASRLWEGRSLMRGYPQLALNVLMLAAGVLEGDLKRSRVELELLHADDSTLESLDPSRPAVVEEAREVVAEMATPLLRDLAYEPSTGRHCHTCEARTWCGPGAEYIAAQPPAQLSPLTIDSHER